MVDFDDLDIKPDSLLSLTNLLVISHL